MNVIELDVSELPAPEPWLAIMRALADLQAEQVLLVKHSREPFPLYQKLTELGFHYDVNKTANQLIEIRISS